MKRAVRIIRRAALFVLALTAIWIVVTGIFITGCAGKKPQSPEEKVQANSVELRKTLKDTIKDTGRLQQMLAFADLAAADLEADSADLAELLKAQDRLNADYNASREEFRQLGDRLEGMRKKNRSTFMKAHHAIAQLATDDEWKKIAAHNFLAILEE
jgi:hypothetical protein